jgi:hypothetical protein
MTTSGALRGLATTAATIETLQFRLDAANADLRDAVETLLSSGTETIADIGQAAGMSQTEIFDLLKHSQRDSSDLQFHDSPATSGPTRAAPGT